MLTSKEYRARAWNALTGNWGTVVITLLLVMVVTSVCSAMSVVGIGAIALFLLEGPILYGYAVQHLNVVRGMRADVNDITAAKNRLTDTIIAYIINSIFTFLWSLLFIIPGIIAAYSYSMTYYILADNPTMTADQARRESIRLMTGNKWALFKLHFSFIGWILLCALTLGILTLWVAPYMECATAEFYESLIPPRPTVVRTDNNNNNGGTDNKTIDPFDLNNNSASSNTASGKTDEPFYVFEEERPRENPDNPDSTISDKK